MKNKKIIYQWLWLFIVLIVSISCNKEKVASKILQKTINKINTIETIYYNIIIPQQEKVKIGNPLKQGLKLLFRRSPQGK